MYPEDVDPESDCRLPLPRREELDDAGQRTYDSLADPEGGTVRGPRGPGGILLHQHALRGLDLIAGEPPGHERAREGGVEEVDRQGIVERSSHSRGPHRPSVRAATFVGPGCRVGEPLPEPFR